MLLLISQPPSVQTSCRVASPSDHPPMRNASFNSLKPTNNCSTIGYSTPRRSGALSAIVSSAGNPCEVVGAVGLTYSRTPTPPRPLILWPRQHSPLVKHRPDASRPRRRQPLLL